MTDRQITLILTGCLTVMAFLAWPRPIDIPAPVILIDNRQVDLITGDTLLEDYRASCLVDLYRATGQELEALAIIDTLNYVDERHGGPCEALAHLEEHGDY
jgi:hypothetical protein